MLFQNPLRRLAPNGYVVPPDVAAADPEANASPLMSLAQGQQLAPSPLIASGQATGTDTPILNQYSKLLQNPPLRANYQPSTGRKVLGALAGLGAGVSPAGISDGAPIGARFDPKAAAMATSNVVDKPYNDALQDYDVQAKTLGEGANVEEKKVTNERGIAKLQADMETKQREDAIKEQNARTAEEKNQNIFATKQAELQAKVDKANADLTEKQKEFESKQGNFEAQLKLAHDKLDLQDKINELRNTQKDAALAEQTRLHNLEKENWDKQRTDAETRIKALEDATKAKQQPTTTSSTVTTGGKPGVTIGGFHIPFTGSSGTQKTTTTTKGPVSTPQAPKAPAGWHYVAKAGGGWTAVQDNQ